MKRLQLRRHQYFKNNNANFDWKINNVSNNFVQLKYLIDQAQKLLNNFQNDANVALNPEPTCFNLDTEN